MRTIVILIVAVMSIVIFKTASEARERKRQFRVSECFSFCDRAYRYNRGGYKHKRCISRCYRKGLRTPRGIDRGCMDVQHCAVDRSRRRYR